MGNNLGKNLSRHMSEKNSQKLVEYAKKSATGAIKTA